MFGIEYVNRVNVEVADLFADTAVPFVMLGAKTVRPYSHLA